MLIIYKKTFNANNLFVFDIFKSLPTFVEITIDFAEIIVNVKIILNC